MMTRMFRGALYIGTRIAAVKRCALRRPVCFDLTLLGLFFLVLNTPYLVPGRALPFEWFSDTLKLTKPMMTYSGQTLVDGELPLWNPYYYAGVPQHAMACTGVFYPTTPLYGLIEFARAFTFDALLHVFIAGLLVYALCRTAHCARPVAVAFGGATYCAKIFWAFPPLVPYVSYPMTLIALGHIWSLRMLAWTPLALLLLLKLLERPSLRPALGLALVTAVQLLAGEIQMFACQWYILGTLFVIECARRLWLREIAVSAATRSMVACASGAGLGVACGCIQWLPAQELLHLSTRAHGVSLEYLRVWGEGKTIDEAVFNASLMLSCIPLAIAFWAGLLSPREPMRPTLVAVSLLVALLAIWPDTPLAEVIHKVPILGQAREPLRILHPATFLILLAAAREFDRVYRGATRNPAIVASLYVPAAAVSVAIWWRIQHSLWIPAAVAGVFTAITLMNLRVTLTGSPARKTLAGISMALLLLNCVWLHQWTTRPFLTFQYALHREIASFLNEHPGPDRIAIIDEDFMKGFPSVGSCTRNRTLGGSHALLLDDYADWFTALTGTEIVERKPNGELLKDHYDLFSTPDWLRERAYAALDLLSIRYLIFTGDPPDWITRSPDRFALIASGKISVYENKGCLPTAFAVHRVKPATDLGESLTALTDPAFDYRTTAPAPVALDTTQPAHAESVKLVHFSANEAVITVSLDSTGLVVLTDPVYPGWKASLDGGASISPVAAYGIFKAVVVPKGDHTIRFYFDPPRYWIGFAVGLSGLAIVLAAILAGFRARTGPVTVDRKGASQPP